MVTQKRLTIEEAMKTIIVPANDVDDMSAEARLFSVIS